MPRKDTESIYDWDKRIDSYRTRIRQSKKIREENKKAIFDYVEYKTSEVLNGKAVSKARVVKYLYRLKAIAEETDKSFSKLTKEEVLSLLDRLYRKPVIRGTQKVKPSTATKNDIAVILKTFLCWLWKTDKIEYIHPPEMKVKGLTDEDRLTWEDIERLSAAALNDRDPALVQVLFESGARIEELLTMRIRDASPIENNRAYRLTITKSKTAERPTLIIRAAPALQEWLRKHPKKKDKNAPLWVNVERNKDRMRYAGARETLMDMAARANLDKPVNPHNFRKSSASYYQGILSDQELKARYGWKPDSRMLQVYVNPDQRSIEDKMLRAEGLRADDKTQEEIQPKKCFWCKEINPIGADDCLRCGRPLTLDDSMREMESWYDFNRKYEKYKKKLPSESDNAVNAVAELMKRIEELERKVSPA